jgi:hypothetical protein
MWRVSAFVVAAVWAAEDNKPSGTVSIESASVAVGVGVSWGDGILTLNNSRSYRFSLNGLEVGSLGASKIRAEGKVYDRAKVSDFQGMYAAGETSIAVGGGPGALAMRNQNGMVKGRRCCGITFARSLFWDFFQRPVFKPDKAWRIARTRCHPLWCAFMMPGGPTMNTLTYARPLVRFVRSPLPQSAAVQTTLYDLIEAIATEVKPDEEALVTTIVAELLHSHRARFIAKRTTAAAFPGPGSRQTGAGSATG